MKEIGGMGPQQILDWLTAQITTVPLLWQFFYPLQEKGVKTLIVIPAIEPSSQPPPMSTHPLLTLAPLDLLTLEPLHPSSTVEPTPPPQTANPEQGSPDWDGDQIMADANKGDSVQDKEVSQIYFSLYVVYVKQLVYSDRLQKEMS